MLSVIGCNVNAVKRQSHCWGAVEGMIQALPLLRVGTAVLRAARMNFHPVFLALYLVYETEDHGRPWA